MRAVSGPTGLDAGDVPAGRPPEATWFATAPAGYRSAVDHPGVLDRPARLPDGDGSAVLRRRRVLYSATTLVLTVAVGLALVEGLFKVPVYGVTTRTARAAGTDGTSLEVRYGRVVRGALASMLEVRVTRPSGLGDTVQLSVSRAYFELFRTIDVSPRPTSMAATGDADLYTFTAPPDGEFEASWQNEANPLGWFVRRVATVAVLDAAGHVVVSVDIVSDLRP